MNVNLIKIKENLSLIEANNTMQALTFIENEGIENCFIYSRFHNHIYFYDYKYHELKSIAQIDKFICMKLNDDELLYLYIRKSSTTNSNCIDNIILLERGLTTPTVIYNRKPSLIIN